MVFPFVFGETLFGPGSVHDNAGSAIVWILWWPLLPLTYFVVARFWCTVWPFPVVGDFLQRFASWRRPMPAFAPGQKRTLRALVPHFVLICLLAAVNVYMFTQPMGNRAQYRSEAGKSARCCTSERKYSP